MSNDLVLMGSVGSDIHSVANQLLEKELTDKGFEVQNLGVAAPVDEWINLIILKRPFLVLIGSMNGDLSPILELVTKIKQLKQFNGHIVVGGNLKLGSNGNSISEFLEAKNVIVIKENQPTFREISETCRKLYLDSEILNQTHG
jgi:methylmalonyl-CoA mutase cobalamin-binding subunit